MTLLREMMQDFWRWYERHHALNVTIAGTLFGLQLVHLVWLTGDPLADRLFESRCSTRMARCAG